MLIFFYKLVNNNIKDLGMITNRAILKINEKEFDILHLQYSFHRNIDAKGRPATGLQGGDIYIQIESSEDNYLLGQMLLDNAPPVQGSIEILTGEDGQSLRFIEFEKAYIYSQYEGMAESPWLPMLTTIGISPLRLDIDRKIHLDRRWPETNGFQWEEHKPQKAKYVKADSVPNIEITNIYWTDSDNNKIEYIPHNEKTHLYIEAQNINNSIDVNINIKFYSNSNPQEIILESQLEIQLTSNKTKLDITYNENTLFAKNKIVFAKATVNYDSTAKESDSLEIIHRASRLIAIGTESDKTKEVLQAIKDSGLEPSTFTGITNNEILQHLKYSVTTEECHHIIKYIGTNGENHVDLYELIKYSRNNQNSSKNFQSLLTIAQNTLMDVVICGQNYIYTTKGLTFMPKGRYSSDMDELYELYQGPPISKENFIKQNPELSTEKMWSVWSGITLYPDKDAGYGMTRDKKCWIITNASLLQVIGAPGENKMVSTLAHELYGHVLFRIQGKPHSHGEIKSISLDDPAMKRNNKPLEIQILNSETEAEQNYEQHKKTL